MLFFKELKPKTLKELMQIPERYIDAHNKKLPTKATVVKQDFIDTKFAGSGGQTDLMRCFACEDRGHKAVECPSKVLR